ncbi:ATP-binding cassette domain-containing protein [bacterium D16-51]|nr:ATP-binding cassette domain-containing protein [bacterium D16-59]RKI62413.1 ATP-binding cassette domain-containing protein [bacterium D16-51]
MIRLEHITKEFSSKNKKVTAVDDVSIHIQKGEIYGIIGFSGAGKSTLVRCINLLEMPTSGRVYFGDQELTSAGEQELRLARQKMGMIFQQFNLLEQRNVLKNICYPLELAGISKKDRIKRAKELIRLVDMEEKEKAYPSQLSGGQKQRVAIARALATNPEVLLCDEATSALDPITTRAILALLKRINEMFGVTVVIISHEMRVVEQVCGRVAVMSRGAVEEAGEVKEVFLNPKSETARRLILPDKDEAGSDAGRHSIRIAFDGQSSFEPVFASLVLESGIKLNILGANTENIGGRAFGQMLIEMPKEQEKQETVKKMLRDRGIHFEEGRDGR